MNFWSSRREDDQRAWDGRELLLNAAIMIDLSRHERNVHEKKNAWESDMS